MPKYQYRVIPAPTKGKRAKGVKGVQNRFAHGLEDVMNQMGAAGWEYQRAETLPSVERVGLTGSATVYRDVLVFRRVADADLEAFAPELLEAPEAFEDEVEPEPEEDTSEAEADADAAVEAEKA